MKKNLVLNKKTIARLGNKQYSGFRGGKDTYELGCDNSLEIYCATYYLCIFPSTPAATCNSQEPECGPILSHDFRTMGDGAYCDCFEICASNDIGVC